MTYDRDLICDGGCGRASFGRHGDDETSVRQRAVERGWVVWEHRDLCPTCAERFGPF